MNVTMDYANRLKPGINNPRTFATRLLDFIRLSHPKFSEFRPGLAKVLDSGDLGAIANRLLVISLKELRLLSVPMSAEFRRRTLRTLRKTCFVGVRYEVTVQRGVLDGKLSDVGRRWVLRSAFAISDARTELFTRF